MCEYDIYFKYINLSLTLQTNINMYYDFLEFEFLCI